MMVASTVTRGSLVAKLFNRRAVIGAGGAAALVPFVGREGLVAAAPFPTVVTGVPSILFEPVRVFDSRTTPVSLGGGKIVSGSSVGVPVGGVIPNGDPPAAVYVNLTITETEGSGFILVRASDLSGERPLPKTSNINWSSTGQTLANLVLTAVGGENYLEVHAGGNGRTHFILDVQAYVPF